MAFKIGNAGFTSINREGKLSNMAQWAGDPIKMGHVDSDVTLDFNQKNTSFRMSFQPRRQTFFPGIMINRGNGYFENNIRNELFYFKHDSGESFNTIRDYNDVVKVKSELIGDYTTFADLDWQENYYNISDPTFALTMGDDFFAVLRAEEYASYDFSSPPINNHRLYIFNYDFTLRKLLEGDDITPVDYNVYFSKPAWFGNTSGVVTWSLDHNLSSSGNKLAIPDPRFQENDNYYEGIIHIYNTDTLEYEQHIRAHDIIPHMNREYVNPFNNQPNLYPWRNGTSHSYLLGYNGVKIEGNRLATFVAGADTALLLDLDSSDPSNPIWSASMWDPSDKLDVGPGVSGYRDSNRANYNSYVKFDYRKGYYAMSCGVLSSDSANGMLNVLDSTGRVVFQYLSPNPRFGRNIHIAVDSDEPTGYIFCGSHIVGTNHHYSGTFPDPNPKFDCLSIFRWNRDNIFIVDSAFKPSDKEARQFGRSMASDHRKDLLLVGAPHDSEGSLGAVYAYNYKSGTLTNEIKIYDSDSRADGLTNEVNQVPNNPDYPFRRSWTPNLRFGNIIAANAYTDNRVEESQLWNSLTLKKPTGLKDNVGQSGSILITKRTGDISGYTDSDGYFLADSCWWFPGGAEVDSARVLPGLTPSLDAKHPTKDLINYYVFDSDKIFCSMQRDLR